MKNLLFVLMLFGFYSTNSQAAWLVDPSLGYTSSEQKYEFKSGFSGQDNGGKVTGLDFGLKLGYVLPARVWFAVDAVMMSGGSFKGNLSGNDGKLDKTDIYFDVGYDASAMFRLWFGYGISNKSTIKPDTGSDAVLEKGTYYKLGLGFKPMPKLGINLEYFVNNPAQVTSAGVVTTLSDFYDKTTDTGFNLTVSSPLEF